MTYTKKSIAKANRFFGSVADAYEDTMDENSSDEMTKETRAQLGMAFAAFAIGRAREELGFFSAIVMTFRAFMASRKITSAYGDY
jgi:hypothetical protein